MSEPTHTPEHPLGPSVLVVDDDRDMLRWAAGLLEPNGCRVSHASDALTGISAVRTVKPAVIVLDTHLPGGGVKVFLERLRHLTAFQKTPVLLLSADLNAKVAASLQPFGIAGMLEKPANPRLFIQTVLQLARKRSPTPL